MRLKFAPILALALASMAGCRATLSNPQSQLQATSDIISTKFILCPRSNQNDTWKWTNLEEVAMFDASSFRCDSNERGETLDFKQQTPLITNNSTSNSIWVTIYDLGETRQLDYGCVSKNSTRRWAAGQYTWGSFYKVRAEVKQNADCGGATLFDTRYQAYATVTDPQSVISSLLYSGSGYYWASGNGGAGPKNAPQLPTEPVLIRTRANSDLVLSIDRTHPSCTVGGRDLFCPVIVRKLVPGDSSQSWERSYHPEGGVIFKNSFSKMLLWAEPGNEAKVTMVGPNRIEVGSRWTIGGDCNSNCALRPYRDSGQNLNILQGGSITDGRAVGTYEWTSGAENETWSMSFATVKKTSVTIRSPRGLVLAVDKNNPNCRADAADGTCPIILAGLNASDMAQVRDREEDTTGYTFRNQLTGKLLWTPGGNGAQVSLIQNDLQDGGSRWSLGGDCSSFCALRPLRDLNQNLNVLGGTVEIGKVVGTWEWGGGNMNEIWQIEPRR